MNENKQNTTLLTVIAVATLLVAVVGATFAYFTAASTEGSTSIVEVSGGKLAMTIDGSTNWTMTDSFEPDSDNAFASQTFTIEAIYDVNMDIPFTINFVYSNPFTTTDIMALLTNTTGDTNGYTLTNSYSSQTALLRGTDKTTALATGKFLGSAVVSGQVVSKTLSFELKLFFPETGVNQDDDKKKSFTGHLALATTEAEGRATTATVAAGA